MTEAAAAPILDLGTLDGPMLLFGGPYGNREATEAIFAEAEALGIPAGRVLCTGDVVAYCADPQATVDRIRAAGIAVVMGNCEEAVAANAADCGCGFPEGGACSALAERWYAFALGALDDAAKSWMRALPRRIAFTLGGRRLAAIHGGVGEISHYLFASTPAVEKETEINRAGVEGIVAGHCGLPFTQVLGERVWHNPGVIGLPANDGTARVWYSLVRPVDGGILFEHRPLAYNHAEAARKLLAHGLPAGYAEGLRTGRWPSLEVLPPAERKLAGRRLEPERVFWADPRADRTKPGDLRGTRKPAPTADRAARS